MIDTRSRLLLAALRRRGPLSRWELHESTDIRPNTVGTDIAALIDRGIVREGAAMSEGRGRPRVPLEIDTDRRRVVGVAIRKNHVTTATLALDGEPTGAPTDTTARSNAALVQAAADAVQQAADDTSTLGIGLTLPGFIDPATRQVLLSAALPSKKPTDIAPVIDAAGDVPLVLGNDMQALAARWMLTSDAAPHAAPDAVPEATLTQQDVLLTLLDDGQVGAALLVAGQPNRGCVIGANELGHTRLPVDTEPCFCGQTGCIERIFSRTFIDPASADAESGDAFAQALEQPQASPRVAEMLDHLAVALSNAVNFTRVHALVIMSPLAEIEPFRAALEPRIRERLLPVLRERVELRWADQMQPRPSRTAAWLPLACLYLDGWEPLARSTIALV